MASAAIFLYAMRAYTRRFYRIDGNILNLTAFTALSVPASYAYGNAFVGAPETDAAIKNN